jgi:hypothetical protein
VGHGQVRFLHLVLSDVPAPVLLIWPAASAAMGIVANTAQLLLLLQLLLQMLPLVLPILQPMLLLLLECPACLVLIIDH